MPPKDLPSCIICRLRKKKCGGPVRPGQTEACENCTRLNIECLHGYGLPVPHEFRNQRVIQRIKEHNRCLANRTGPPLQLQRYITTPLPHNVASPSGFHFDGQNASPNGVFASASPYATGIPSISVRDAAHPPAAPLPIAGDDSFHQTQRPLFDYSVGSYTPDGMVAHNGLDGFTNYFTPDQQVYHFSESGPPPFDLLFTHQTADPQNLWLDGNDPRDITGHQDAQNLDTSGSGLEFLSEIFPMQSEHL